MTKETTSAPKNGETYALGEKITYKIVVKNDGNLTITEIEVKDTLNGKEETLATGVTLQPEESKEYSFEHIVTEADILAGKVVNEATAKDKSPDPEKPDAPVDPGKTEDDPEPKKGHLTVTKETTSAPKNGETYALGEKITYKIVVKNDGNLTITEIEVKDTLNGKEETLATGVTLQPEESKEYSFEHIVTEADILAGKVVNEATAKGKSPDPEKPDAPVDPGKTEDDPELKNGHLTVTKETTSTPKNGETYALGEKITYKIVVKNDGNLTITEIEVKDTLNGKEETLATGVTLQPEESKEYSFEHIVTEADILAGKVVNEATAKGKSPDPEKPDAPVDPGKTEDDPEPKKGHLTVTKETTSAPKNGETYALGEKITYKIVVKNDGNLTITEIEVKDTLNGKEETLATGVTLQPEESKEYSFEHIVTEADILAGKVVNEATAKGKSPDSEKPDAPVDPGKTEDDPDETRAVLDIDKKVKGQDADQDGIYRYGETAQYALVISNLGNVTLRNVTATDAVAGVEMREGAGYQLVNGEAVIGELKPGESMTVNVAYPIQRGDIQEKVSTFTNTAQVNGEATVRKDGKTETVRLSDTDSETVQIDRKYQYTVQHYTREPGRHLAAPGEGRYLQ